MRLFSEMQRDFLGLRAYSDSSYDYLNRSARLEMRRVRDLLEDWFSRYPAKGQEELAARFRSPETAAFESATFELYLHELLLCLGYQMEVHPRVSAEHDRHLDFLASDSSGSTFYLEATTATDDWWDDRGAGQRIATILDKINEMGSIKFYLQVRVIHAPSTSPSVRNMKKKLLDWMSGLDTDTILRLWDHGDYNEIPRFLWEDRSGKIEFCPIPKELIDRGDRSGRVIHIQSFGAKFLATSEVIRKAVRDKATRYGDMVIPYVIAVNASVVHLSGFDIMNALFGHETYVVPPRGSGQPIQRMRKPDGAWFGPQGPRNTGVSAVLLVEDLKPWAVAWREPCLYLNPFARRQCSGRILELTRAEMADGCLVHHEGIKPRGLFGLPSDWPGEIQISI